MLNTRSSTCNSESNFVSTIGHNDTSTPGPHHQQTMTYIASLTAATAAATRIRHLSQPHQCSLTPSAFTAPASKLFQSTSSISASVSSNDDVTADLQNARSNITPLLPPKRLLFLRHGQALHNPRAEKARENGCSFDEFLALMEEDDSYDACLTPLGEDQARDAGRQPHVRHAFRQVDMVISSPLSRALRTADLALESAGHDISQSKRVVLEHFREINGKLLNAQRRPRTELEMTFSSWNFSHIPAFDESWTEELEERHECGERGYQGLLWVMDQSEKNVLVVCHGGLLNYMMNGHPRVVLLDGRHQTKQVNGSDRRCVSKRFGNCELREFVLTAWACEEYASKTVSNALNQLNGTKLEDIQPIITLEEVTMLSDR